VIFAFSLFMCIRHEATVVNELQNCCRTNMDNLIVRLFEVQAELFTALLSCYMFERIEVISPLLIGLMPPLTSCVQRQS